MELFSLYFNKEKAIIEIYPKRLWNVYGDTKQKILEYGITQYNNNYFLATNRKLLREKSKEIQEKWIKEAKEQLEIYSNLKVINKY